MCCRGGAGSLFLLGPASMAAMAHVVLHSQLSWGLSDLGPEREVSAWVEVPLQALGQLPGPTLWEAK